MVLFLRSEEWHHQDADNYIPDFGPPDKNNLLELTEE